MAKSHLKDLQQAASQVTHMPAMENKIESLGKAFALFTAEAEKLQRDHEALKYQYQLKNRELQLANEALQSKLIEFDTITYYLNSILSNISQGLLFIDFNGVVTTYNSAAELILGHKSKQVLFYPFWSNFEDEIFNFSMRKALTIQQVPKTSYAFIKNLKEETIELEIEVSFLQRLEENFSSSVRQAMQGLIVLIRDITVMRHLQAVANRNDRLKELGEMAAMVAHEIRNPLGGIKGFASLLQRDLQERPELQKMASYIVEGTDNLNRLVTTILNYARPIKLEKEWIDLVHLGRELILHLQADANVPQTMKMKVVNTAEELLVLADQSSIKGALLNLMVNSIQAMPDGGELTLKFEEEKGYGIIIVKDTGIGISTENLEKLYSPFFTTRANGNGFGLAEVWKIVQAHEGIIEVDSIVGKETSFTIKIPLKK